MGRLQLLQLLVSLNMIVISNACSDCIFPFKYSGNNATYHSCSWLKSHFMGGPWCSTKGLKVHIREGFQINAKLEHLQSKKVNEKFSYWLPPPLMGNSIFSSF